MEQTAEKWNLIVDVALCENCHNCTLAAKDEHVGNDFPGYAAPQPLHGSDWILIERSVKGEGAMVEANYRPSMCNHCDNAPCLEAGGKDGAVIKRKDGIILIDPGKAKGRKDLVESCPYGAIAWNEALELPQIWIFDAHLLDQGWKEPRCAQSCPTGAYEAVKTTDDAMALRAEQEGLEVLRPELNTKPRVFYRHLHLFDKEFIGGCVTAVVDGVEECIEGVDVMLYRDDERVSSTSSDGFGDFKIHGLDRQEKGLRLELSHARHGKASIAVDLSEGSRYFDPLPLS